MKVNNTLSAAQLVSGGWKYRAVLIEARAARRELQQYGPRRPQEMRTISLIRRRSGTDEHKVTINLK